MKLQDLKGNEKWSIEPERLEQDYRNIESERPCRVELPYLESENNFKENNDISFGSSREGFSAGHSESYWKEKAGKELVEKGKTSSYELYMKRAGEAAAADMG